MMTFPHHYTEYFKRIIQMTSNVMENLHFHLVCKQVDSNMKLTLLSIKITFIVSIADCSLLKIDNKCKSIEKLLTIYIDKLAKCNFTKYSRCYVLFDKTDSLENNFIKHNRDCSFLITTNEKNMDYQNIYFKVQHLFAFLSSDEKLAEITEMILNNTLWNTATKTYFIITSSVDKKSIPGILSHIWSQKITNFVLVVVNAKLRVYTYNDFDDNKVEKISGKDFCRKQFLEKTRNLHQKPLKSVLCNQIPYTLKENGKWSGIEIQLLELFTNAINASKLIIEKSSPNSSILALQNGEADIYFSRVFQVFYYVNVDYSYPYGMGEKVVMVPKPTRIPPYMNIFYIFDRTTWTCLFSVITLLPFVFIMSDNHPQRLDTFLNYHFYLWSVLLNMSVQHGALKTSLKWLLSVWIWCCLILSAAFQSSLLRSFLKPMYSAGIKNMDDLSCSELKLHLHPYFAASKDLADTFNLRHKYVEEELTETGKYLENRDTSSAYVVTRELAEYHMNKLKKINGDSTYEILEENLVPGVVIIHLQKNSLFLATFDRFVLLFKQHGLIKEEVLHEAKVRNDTEVLSMTHFLAVFSLLGIGLSCGVVILIGEILWYKFSKYSHTSIP